MKGIVLVNPPLSLSERYGTLAKGGTSLPPLGLTILAAAIRKNNIPVSILDASALGLSSEETVKQILKSNPAYVGFTASTISIHRAADIARDIKKAKADIVTLIGGPHLTALPTQTFKLFPQFDIGVVGEGEIATIKLLESLEQNKVLDGIAGLIYRQNGTIISTPRAELIKNLDELPMDAWDLLTGFPQLYKSSVHKLGRLPTTSLITSRGCPYECRFCDNSMFGRKVRAYSSGRLMEIVRYLMKNYGIKDIFFNDDNFVMMRKRLVDFCDTIQKEKLDLTWGCYGRIDNITDESMLKLMRKAGCLRISFGLESGSQDILNFYKKNETLEQMAKVISWTRKAGIRSKGFFMMGNFLETKQTLQKTIDFAKKIKLDDFHVTFLTPLPGSEIYSIADKYGTFNNDWRKMSMWYPVFIPKGLSRDILERYKKKAILRFYLRPRIILAYLKQAHTAAGRRTIYRMLCTFFEFFFVKPKK